MARRIALVALAALFLLACASQGPEYIVQSSGPQRLSRADAQNVLIEQYLQQQISPPLDKPLKVRTLVLPPYPRELWQAQIEGKVRVRFRINEDGAAADPSIAGTAHSVLAAYSMSSVLQWKFEPMTRGGKPVSMWLTYEFIFRLE